MGVKMKIVLGQLLKIMGWKRLLKMTWDIVDDDIKKKVAESDNKWDDEAVRVVDELIKDLTA